MNIRQRFKAAHRSLKRGYGDFVPLTVVTLNADLKIDATAVHTFQHIDVVDPATERLMTEEYRLNGLNW